MARGAVREDDLIQRRMSSFAVGFLAYRVSFTHAGLARGGKRCRPVAGEGLFVVPAWLLGQSVINSISERL